MDNPLLSPIVSDLPQSDKLPFVSEGCLGIVCGLKHAARRKLKIVDLCLANKEQQLSVLCQLGNATHSDSSASSMERRNFTKKRPSVGSDVRFFFFFFCLL